MTKCVCHQSKSNRLSLLSELCASCRNGYWKNLMNLKKLTIKELYDLINKTTDLNLLQKAQDEYVNRVCRPEILDELNDEDLQ